MPMCRGEPRVACQPRPQEQGEAAGEQGDHQPHRQAARPGPRGNRQVVEAVGLEGGDRFLERRGSEDDVGVGEQQQLATGRGGADVHGVVLAQPAVGQVADGDDLQFGVSLVQTGKDRRGAVARAIVDDHHLLAGVVQGQHRAKRGLDLRLLVARRDEDRHARPGGRAVADLRGQGAGEPSAVQEQHDQVQLKQQQSTGDDEHATVLLPPRIGNRADLSSLFTTGCYNGDTVPTKAGRGKQWSAWRRSGQAC